MKKNKIKTVLLSLTLSIMAINYFGFSEMFSENSSLNDIFNINVVQAESGSKEYQSIGYCTKWRMDWKCTTSGTTTCTKDC